MLQEDQRTSAPSAVSVSISAPVWIVMCRQPAMRAPLSGCDLPYSLRSAMRPGISVSAMFSSLRPQSARLISRTLKSPVLVSGAADIRLLLLVCFGQRYSRRAEAEQASRESKSAFYIKDLGSLIAPIRDGSASG